MHFQLLVPPSVTAVREKKEAESLTAFNRTEGVISGLESWGSERWRALGRKRSAVVLQMVYNGFSSRLHGHYRGDGGNCRAAGTTGHWAAATVIIVTVPRRTAVVLRGIGAMICMLHPGMLLDAVQRPHIAESSLHRLDSDQENQEGRE